METKDKKSVVTYYSIETRDLRPGIFEEDYWDWDEIDCKNTLDEAKAAYEKQLTTSSTLRLVQVTRTTIVQSYKTPKFIGDLERNLNETRENVYDCLVAFLKTVGHQDYTCAIPIAHGDTVTELSLDYGNRTIWVRVCSRDTPLDLSQLSIEDQLTILKAVPEN